MSDYRSPPGEPASDSDPTWSILIVFYDDLPALQTCLAAVELQGGGGFEILVVDNRGLPGVAGVVAAAPHARLLSPGRNLGYGAGNNLAAAVATGLYLLILNPDTVPGPDLLRRLGAAFARLPAGVLVTPTLLLPDGRVNAQGNAVTYSGLTTCRNLHAHHAEDDLHAVPAISGAAFAVRRTDFFLLAGFDERFFLYLEDTDLSLRARLLGGSCWCAGDAVAVHDYHWRLSPAKLYELEKNRLVVLLALFQVRTLLVLLPGLLLTELYTGVYAALRGPAYVGAILRAYSGVVGGRDDLRDRRRRLQAGRRVDDAVLLALCGWRVPFRQQAGPVAGTMLELLARPGFFFPWAAARALDSCLSVARRLRGAVVSGAGPRRREIDEIARR
jgi:GT2 family glycosyltransferase